MFYPKYFKEGQKVLLRRIDPSPSVGQLDSLSGELVDCSEEAFDVRLPYCADEEEGYPFFQGMPFEVLSDCFGLGLRFTGLVDGLFESGRVRLRPQGDLEFFFRRKHLRATVSLWLGYRRSTQSLRTLRRTWSQHTKVLQSGHNLSEMPPVSQQSLCLGGGGLQLNLPAPVIVPELCLVYLALSDKGPLVCTLCETVWVTPPDNHGTQNAGLQFQNILDPDQERIVRLVKNALRISSPIE